MEWKYYEFLKTLEGKYGADIIKTSIPQVIDDQFVEKTKWVNRTTLEHNDYWILNSVAKSVNFEEIKIIKTLDRIVSYYARVKKEK